MMAAANHSDNTYSVKTMEVLSLIGNYIDDDEEQNTRYATQAPRMFDYKNVHQHES